MLDIVDIRRRIPHRYPFLLVDRVTELEPGQRIVAIKNVTINEPYFTGHYPDQPLMPGVLIAEAMAQAGGLIFLGSSTIKEDAVPLLVGIDSLRFRRVVTPGDQLRIEARVARFVRGIAKIEAKATVEDDVAAEGELMFALRSAEDLADSSSKI